LLSIVILANMKESLVSKKRFKISHLKINKHDIIAWQVVPAALIILLSYVSYGVILTVISDWAAHLGTSNKGLFFMVFTLTSLLIRFIAGKASDVYGRITILKVSLVLLALALVGIGLANSPFTLMAASALYGVATGMLSPTATAWTVDLSNPQQRGKAMATMYIFLEVGIGLGALFAGWLFITDFSVIPFLFYCTAAVSLIAWLYLQFVYKKAMPIANNAG
jgi:MFS family permease